MLMAAVSPPHRASPTARTVTLETHSLVGRLMDCQILAGYADQAIAMASCPENVGPVSVAREAIGKLIELLRAETGRLDGAA